MYVCMYVCTVCMRRNRSVWSYHRLSPCIRCCEDRHGHHPSRDSELRHRDHTGLLRTIAGLCCHQGSALGPRQVRRGVQAHWNCHEECRRGHGHRSNVGGEYPEVPSHGGPQCTRLPASRRCKLLYIEVLTTPTYIIYIYL